jgi:hypothetical protein
MDEINTPSQLQIIESAATIKKVKGEPHTAVTTTSILPQIKRRRRVYTKGEDEIILKAVQESGSGDLGSNLWLSLGKEMNRIPQDLKRRYFAIINPKKNKLCELDNAMRNEILQNNLTQTKYLLT